MRNCRLWKRSNRAATLSVSRFRPCQTAPSSCRQRQSGIAPQEDAASCHRCSRATAPGRRSPACCGCTCRRSSQGSHSRPAGSQACPSALQPDCRCSGSEAVIGFGSSQCTTHPAYRHSSAFSRCREADSPEILEESKEVLAFG